MEMLESRFVEVVDIPDSEKGFTKKNESYFNFGKTPQVFLTKKAPVLIGIMIMLYALTFLIESQILYTLVVVLILAVGSYYAYENRYKWYFKQASKGYYFNKYHKMMKYLDKILDSKYVYTEGLPLHYMILKSKQLLSKGNYEGAEFLIDKILAEYPSCPEMQYMKAICLYQKESYKESKKYFEKSSKKLQDKRVKKSALEMLKRLECTTVPY